RRRPVDRQARAGRPRKAEGRRSRDARQDAFAKDRSHLLHRDGPPRRGRSEDRRPAEASDRVERRDRKSTRLNSSHLVISYAVFCRHPPLHSFPTRRSSDLDDGRWIGKLAQVGLGKLKADDLATLAKTPSQKTEAIFYIAMDRRAAGDPKIDDQLKQVIASSVEIGRAHV